MATGCTIAAGSDLRWGPVGAGILGRREIAGVVLVAEDGVLRGGLVVGGARMSSFEPSVVCLVA